MELDISKKLVKYGLDFLADKLGTVSERTFELSSKYGPKPLYPVIFTLLHPKDLTEEAE